jgi:hypothetical protein
MRHTVCRRGECNEDRIIGPRKSFLFLGCAAFNITTPFGGQIDAREPSALGEILSACGVSQTSLTNLVTSKSLKSQNTATIEYGALGKNTQVCLMPRCPLCANNVRLQRSEILGLHLVDIDEKESNQPSA